MLKNNPTFIVHILYITRIFHFKCFIKYTALYNVRKKYDYTIKFLFKGNIIRLYLVSETKHKLKKI